MEQTKYVIIKTHGMEVSIVFSELLDHSIFKNLNPISAGFVWIKDDCVKTGVESIGLRLSSRPQDCTIIARDLKLK